MRRSVCSTGTKSTNRTRKTEFYKQWNRFGKHCFTTSENDIPKDRNKVTPTNVATVAFFNLSLDSGLDNVTEYQHKTLDFTYKYAVLRRLDSKVKISNSSDYYSYNLCHGAKAKNRERGHRI